MNQLSNDGQNNSSVVVDCGSMDVDQQRIWSNFEFWCEGIIFSIVGGFGLIGNLLSIAILSTKEMRCHSFNNLLTVQACFDILFILTGVPVHVSPIFNLEGWFYSIIYPYFLYPFTAVSFTGSIYMTVALTVERYIAVCHPTHYRNLNVTISNMCRVLVYTLPVATASVLLNIPKFLEAKVSFNNETGAAEYNVTQLRLNPEYIWWYTMSYICHPTLTTAILPFILLIFLNFKIFSGIRKARTQVHLSQRHGEMNLASVLVMICVVFMLCHLLRVYLAIQAVIFVDKTFSCMSQPGTQAWIPPYWILCLESVSNLLTMVSSSTNFIIYCTMSTKFKIYLSLNFCFRSVRTPNPDTNAEIKGKNVKISQNKEEFISQKLNGSNKKDGTGSKQNGTQEKISKDSNEMHLANHSRTNDLKNPNRTVAQIHTGVDNFEKVKLAETADVHIECFHLEEITV